MTPQQFKNEKVFILATAKLFSDQSTYVLNEMKHKAKYNFNLAIKQIDLFISEIEKKLDDMDKERLRVMTDALNNGMAELRKIINEKEQEK